jgi:hypothetical protein
MDVWIVDGMRKVERTMSGRGDCARWMIRETLRICPFKPLLKLRSKVKEQKW